MFINESVLWKFWSHYIKQLVIKIYAKPLKTICIVSVTDRFCFFYILLLQTDVFFIGFCVIHVWNFFRIERTRHPTIFFYLFDYRYRELSTTQSCRSPIKCLSPSDLAGFRALFTKSIQTAIRSNQSSNSDYSDQIFFGIHQERPRLILD